FLALATVVAGVLLAMLGAAATGASRLQRAADLVAVSAARSMRDDHHRLFLPATLATGVPNPAHLSDAEYRARATAAALEASQKNGADSAEVAVTFPGAGFAPTRVRVALRARASIEGTRAAEEVEAKAIAEAYPVSSDPSAAGVASGGGYSGPLVMRQGEGMRPDVAQAFDAMSSAASRDGHALLVNSGFRSDAEQAALFAANPDPRMVARPGTSLHRCATELDLGPPSAYGWLAANAQRFGFVQRYSWEAWHYGFTRGPAPCSAAGDSASQPSQDGDGAGSQAGLPSFVPARFRAPIAGAAARWNVPGNVLAAQLLAESNFNPFAVSPAGARGIAQFMPATAAAYGLSDPFDPEAAINAQGRLMADLIEQFGDVSLALAAYNAGPAPVQACSCVPPYPETQAYVARILGLMGGVGAIPPPGLEVRLVG
ncbi:MAG: transglycosylase SLT domain-containing protein, partial [Actinomycetota bacterium]|nr:transglycosylase SLT domain-containing protein [Actinomycetota bacterium]